MKKVEKIEILQDYIDHAEKIVFFGGAGVSTESGVPDFRSQDGLYHQTYKYPPETILSHSFYMSKKKDFYDFYFDKLLTKGILPNKAHKKLYELEAAGKDITIVTQNIDGLHQAAGSGKVLELHGSVLHNYCVHCGRSYPLSFMLETTGIPHCTCCRGTVRPDIVLYGEGLDGDCFLEAEQAISAADVLLVGGSSLTVQPAASLVGLYRGKHLILINRTPTPYDDRAELVIRDPIETVLPVAVDA